MEKETKQKPGHPAGGEGKKNKLKPVLLTLLILLLAAGGFIAWRYYNTNMNFFTTDNARVTAQMYPVTAPAGGKLLNWDVEAGDRVTEGLVLGRTETLPYITAPADGIIVKNDAVLNQMVAAGAALAVIADTDNLYIGVNIEETDISKISLGQAVDISIDAYPKRVFPGQVTEINQTTQTYFSGVSSFSTSGTYTKVTQLIPVKVSIQNDENVPLMFGMNATVKIRLR